MIENERSMKNLKVAALNTEDLEEIRSLEKKLGDICLIAVEKNDAIFALEAKIGPNAWEPVDPVYPDIENLRAYYADEKTAHLSKGALKSFLHSNKHYKKLKKPIRVRKID